MICAYVFFRFHRLFHSFRLSCLKTDFNFSVSVQCGKIKLEDCATSFCKFVSSLIFLDAIVTRDPVQMNLSLCLAESILDFVHSLFIGFWSVFVY